uniref:Uncharacterized protein n=1 Tax=Anopheles melas TaxID=34690 RepID=A0A182TDS6_9DIPT
MKPMYVIARRSVSMRDNRFSYAKVGTLRRSLSNASFRLNMRRRSRMLAARRCAIEATRRRVFLVDPLDGAGWAPRGESRWLTKLPTCCRGQIAIYFQHRLSNHYPCR